MLKPLSSAPTFTSAEDHAQLTSSTPTSFSDIPPVLHFTADSAEIALAPVGAGWESWASSSGAGVGAEGRTKGRLWVTEAAVSFVPSTPDLTGWTIPFPALTLHALTPASPDQGAAHVYCQIDESDAPASARSALHSAGVQPDPTAVANGHDASNGTGEDGADGDGNGVEDEDDYQGAEEDEDAPMREIRIYVPDSQLRPLFSALSHCSGLHASLLPSGEPSSFFGFSDNPDGPEDEWEDADDAMEDAEEDTEGGRAVLAPWIKGGLAREPVQRAGLMRVPRPAGWDRGDGGEEEEEGHDNGDQDEDLAVRFADALDLRNTGASEDAPQTPHQVQK